MYMRLPTALALLTLASAPLGAQTVVALDGYHNAERAMPEHYQWEGTTDGGFSKLANGGALAASIQAASAFGNTAALSALQSQGKLNASALSAMQSNPAAFSAMASNPSAFSALANNPAALAAFSRNASAFSALANNANFRALVGNPAFGAALKFGNVASAINQAD